MVCFANCNECNQWKECYNYYDDFYCDICSECYELRNFRCFSFAAIYNSKTIELLSIGSSRIGIGCAERQAMWKLNDIENIPKH